MVVVIEIFVIEIVEVVVVECVGVYLVVEVGGEIDWNVVDVDVECDDVLCCEVFVV